MSRQIAKSKLRTRMSIILIILISCSLTSTIKAQGLKEITGVVRDDASNKALSDVSVKVKGTDKGGLTDAEGKYTI
ncbi:MAG: carboxypeptidase-like regulatory domain-containing protein, partial [Ginsengibacter sp.]